MHETRSFIVCITTNEQKDLFETAFKLNLKIVIDSSIRIYFYYNLHMARLLSLACYALAFSKLRDN